MSEPANSFGRGAITVVVPTKDRAELLAQTLRSVREQTLVPARIIVADDGSTDRTESVVAAAGAERLHNPRGDWGPATARNAALREVSSEFVAFLDSDDLLFPHALEALAARLAAEPQAPFAYGRGLSARREESGWTVEGLIQTDPDELRDPLCALFSRNSVPSSGALVRTASLRKVGGYDENVTWAEDHHLWVRLALGGAPAYSQELVCVHRRHQGNRHSPRVAHGDADAILRLADENGTLAACLPGRVGVELCEVALSTLKERPLQLPATVRPLLSGRTGRGAVLRRSARHWRARRRWAAEGTRLWRGDPQLRSWLSGY
jgi:cellulose synthase/poly-beta-1,6-N-acetylglucosamine synthase-like glycosyltransferase